MDIKQNFEQNPKKTWTVVLFETDSSVEAIPTSWLTSTTECVYPPFTGDKVLQAIKSNLELNTCWPTFKVRPFRNATYGKQIIESTHCKLNFKLGYHRQPQNVVDTRFFYII